MLLCGSLFRDVLAKEQSDRQAAIDSGKARETKIAFFIVDKVALAIQQAEFLQRTTAGRIGLLYGALGVDNFSEAQWADVHLEHDLVVLTADILKSAFARGFLKIERANLLVYDEAHHCQASHAYALIQQEFYHKVEPSKRPKIFGMTASPVSQTRNRPESVVFDLERLLDATICTPDPDNNLQEYVVRPNELEVFYERACLSSLDLPILSRLELLLAPIKSMKKFVNNVQFAYETLGAWAAVDLMLFFCQEQHWKTDAKATTDQSGYSQYEQEMIDTAKEEMKRLKRPSLADLEQSMTPKGALLIDLLRKIYKKAQEQNDADPVTIVFCERRSTAKLLMIAVTDYMRESMPGNLRASLFIGHGSTSEGDYSMAMQTQALVVEEFRKNKFKYCLYVQQQISVLTSIVACSRPLLLKKGSISLHVIMVRMFMSIDTWFLSDSVIKFDPTLSCIRYIQSRGRARKSGSSYITMLEDGDTAARAHQACVKDAERIIRDLCETLPEDRIVRLHNTDGTEDVATDDRTLPGFEAIAVVGSYCRSLPADDFVSIKPQFGISNTGMGFMATCSFPAISGIPMIRGSVQKSKSSLQSIEALTLKVNAWQRLMQRSTLFTSCVNETLLMNSIIPGIIKIWMTMSLMRTLMQSTARNVIGPFVALDSGSVDTALSYISQGSTPGDRVLSDMLLFFC